MIEYTGCSGQLLAFHYIEILLNPKRKHARDGMLSPLDFERQQILQHKEGQERRGYSICRLSRRARRVDCGEGGVQRGLSIPFPCAPVMLGTETRPSGAMPNPAWICSDDKQSKSGSGPTVTLEIAFAVVPSQTPDFALRMTAA
ncbi:hypothetical protein BMI87_21575 [Thioclava sp. F28-4]|nr:hypothetical protein BMI87_21575 [Thioclava sp. F28-4]